MTAGSTNLCAGAHQTDGAADAPRGLRGGRMRARAHVTTTLEATSRGGNGRTRLSSLRSEAPLILRPTNGKGREPWVRGDRHAARVSLTAGSAGPIGGDELELTVQVGAGSTLVLSEISHTLLLPSHDRAVSTTTTQVTVGPGATLVWLPEPIIAAHHCDHLGITHIDLAAGARLLVREELLLGRHNEPSGQLRQSMRVTREGQPVYHQDLQLGGEISRTPAVSGQYRAVGSVLVVDPDWTPEIRPAARRLGATSALMPLAAGDAVIVSAVAEDSLDLRAAIDTGIAALGRPWNPDSSR